MKMHHTHYLGARLHAAFKLFDSGSSSCDQFGRTTDPTNDAKRSRAAGYWSPKIKAQHQAKARGVI
jgi:hypothetical protein